MASIPSPFSLSTANVSTIFTFTSSSFLDPLSRKQCQAFKHSKPRNQQVSKVTCCANKNNPTPKEPPHIVGHRRNVLIGLGGLCGAATLGNNPLAFAAPISPPDSVVSTVVKRPKKSRSKKEKEEKEEVLVIEGIEFDSNKAVKFDVLINDEDDKLISPENTEFAGSFVSVPHSQKQKNITTSFRLGLSNLLEDLGAEDDDSVVVTLVPRYGKGEVKIRGIKIELVDD